VGGRTIRLQRMIEFRGVVARGSRGRRRLHPDLRFAALQSRARSATLVGVAAVPAGARGSGIVHVET